jgi:guanylate kinase
MLVLVGASASGKTECARYLIEHYGYQKAITTTTRPQRDSETNGVDYHFVDAPTFAALEAQNAFVETTTYHHHRYGLQKKDAHPEHIVIVDPRGANALYEALASSITIVVIQSPLSLRRERMRQRGDNERSIEERLMQDEKLFALESFIHIDHVLSNKTQTIEALAQTMDAYYRSHAQAQPSKHE